MLRGDHERARPACVEALEVARNLGLPRVEAEVLITLGALTQGDEGERILEDGVALAVDAHDPGQITRGYNNLAEHRLREGSLAEIGSLYEEARDWGERFGARGNVLWFSARQAGYLYIVGEWDRALDRSAEHLDALAKAATTHYLEGLATAIRGEIRFARGETEAGLADMRRAHELSKGLEDPQAVLPSIGELGRILLLEGKVDEARALTAHLASAELSYWNATLPIAWLLTGLGEEEQLLLLLDRADDLTRSSTWGRAAELLARGDATAAGNLLDQCGSRAEAAFARWRAAEQLGAQGRRAEANEQLALALAFFRSVGAVRYTREAERLLAQPA